MKLKLSTREDDGAPIDVEDFLVFSGESLTEEDIAALRALPVGWSVMIGPEKITRVE